MMTSETPYGGMSLFNRDGKYVLTIKDAMEEWDMFGVIARCEHLDGIVDERLFRLIDRWKCNNFLKSGSIDYMGEINDLVFEYDDASEAINKFMEIKLKL